MPNALLGEGQGYAAPLESKRVLVYQYGEPAADLITRLRGSREVQFLESHDPLHSDHSAVTDLVETVTGDMGASLVHPSFTTGEDMEQFDGLTRLQRGEVSDATATLVGSLSLGEVEHDITYVGGKWMIGIGEVERSRFGWSRHRSDRLLVDPYQPAGHVALNQPLSVATLSRDLANDFIHTERTKGVASTRINGAVLLRSVMSPKSSIEEFLHHQGTGAERPRIYGSIVPEPHTVDRSPSMVVSGYVPLLGRRILSEHAQLITSAATHVPDRAAFHLARLNKLGAHPERDGRAPHRHVSSMIGELCLNGHPHIAEKVAEAYLAFERDSNDGTWLADRESNWWHQIAVAYERDKHDEDGHRKAIVHSVAASSLVLARTTDEGLIEQHRRRIAASKFSSSLMMAA